MSFDDAIVRILSEDKQHVLGSGFLLSQTEILTCAHVVAYALDLQDSVGQEISTRSIIVDFKVAPQDWRSAFIVDWQPQINKDLAVLRLSLPCPSGAAPATLKPLTEMWGHTFRSFGFPRNHDYGIWADGRILGGDNRGFVQLEGVTTTGHRIEQGFSGTPVWDIQFAAVVGMVVETDVQGSTKTAFMLPVSLLGQISPHVGRYLVPNQSDTGVAPRDGKARMLFSSFSAPTMPGNLPLPYSLSIVGLLLILFMFVYQGDRLAFPPALSALILSSSMLYGSSIAAALLLMSEALLLWNVSRQVGKQWITLFSLPFLSRVLSLTNIGGLVLVLLLCVQIVTVAPIVNGSDAGMLHIMTLDTAYEWEQAPPPLSRSSTEQRFSSLNTAVVHTFDPNHPPAHIPAYQVILTLTSQDHQHSLEITGVVIVIKKVLITPPALMIKTHLSKSYPAHSFIATRDSYQNEAARITAYPSNSKDYVFLPPEQPTDTINTSLQSTASADIIFNVEVTYVVQTVEYTQTTQDYHVIFAGPDNWHPIATSNSFASA